jgi:MOSC domain-containing protein YiiM
MQEDILSSGTSTDRTEARLAIAPRVRCVLAGPVQPLGRTTSGIAKRPVAGPCSVGPLGLAGDEQADRAVHGGTDKAVHCYAWSNYAYWRSVLPDQPLWHAPGAFGENLSLDGIDEHGVCIGDRWRIGTVLFAVSQGRQPCYKLRLRFGVADMPLRVQDTLRAGWYLRVLEPGQLQAGDACTLVERRHPDHSVACLLALIRDRAISPAQLEPVLALPLTASWRRLFEGRLRSAQVEDWRKRLEGAE